MKDTDINGFRLSPQQKRLWLLQKNSLAYRSQCAILIEGHLEITVLKNAIQSIVNQHEILRTNFSLMPGVKTPVQVIADSSTPLWREIDFKDCNPQQQASKIEELFQEEGNLLFNFTQNCIVRLSLLTLTTQKHILLISLPSLCADSATLNNLFHEISRSYVVYLKGEELAENPLQYVQFSEWQNELLEEDDAETGKAFWRNQDFSILSSFQLPFEGMSGKETEFYPHYLSLAIAPDVAAKVDEIATQYDTSTAILLLAAWQVLLWKLTGKLDIIVGSACDGRQHEMLQEALGLFVKWLPIHCHIEESFKFSEILQQIHEYTHNAKEWQEYFLWENNENPAAESLNFFFFPIGFEFEERAEKAFFTGGSFSIYKQHTCLERFNLKLSCVHLNDSLITEFQYDGKLFDIEDIQRLARQFDTLLQNIVKNLEIPVKDLEILSDSDKYQLLVEFNNTTFDYPKNKCINQLFEEQVERTPNNVAIVFGNQQLTYAELNIKANQLAHYLQKLGVEPEVKVGIYMQRSVEMVVALIAILKAGGGYIPLDITYPKERLAFMLKDACIPVVLTNQQLMVQQPEHNLQVVCLDSDWQAIAQQSKENPISEVKTDNLAYAIYTSGSTGKPKGVMIQHASVVNLVTGLHQAIYSNIAAPLRVSLNAPISFDSSVKQWVQLLHGHALYIIPEDVRLDGNQMLDYIRQHKLDVLDCTPSQLRVLLAAGFIQMPDVPQVVLVGGEALDEAIWTLLANSPNTRFYNVYGPTECTVDTTVCCICKELAQPMIGRPIANTQVYLLDNNFRPVPIGLPGELYIGGSGLARGYLNQPELTLLKFIPNPFSDERGARLYKTGDLGCYLPDSNIKFLGRIDHQVKIRGFRLELGEVEAMLRQHPAVQEAVVKAQENVPGDKRLVSYFIPNQDRTPTISELRSFLREKLPEYMVPSSFALLKTLPLTRNGKVDYKALPDPETLNLNLGVSYVAPKTEIEQTIATIWQQLLQLEKVGINDNFFDIGGHSLLMVQLHNKLQEVFNRTIPLVEMFKYPTIRLLANYLSNQQTEQSSLQKSNERAKKRQEAKNRKTQLTNKGRN